MVQILPLHIYQLFYIKTIPSLSKNKLE